MVYIKKYKRRYNKKRNFRKMDEISGECNKITYETKNKPYWKIVKENENKCLIDKNKYILCYTDGSASQNGNLNAVGGYACFFTDYFDYNIFEIERTNVTNNRCEYKAAIAAIKQFDHIKRDLNEPNKHLIVYTDSMLLNNTVESWMHKWKKNNWMSSNGSKVKNLDLVQQLYELKKDRNDIHFRWIKAHSGMNNYDSIMNDIADQMSRCYKY